jgi:hypothetical protein
MILNDEAASTPAALLPHLSLLPVPIPLRREVLGGCKLRTVFL